MTNSSTFYCLTLRVLGRVWLGFMLSHSLAFSLEWCDVKPNHLLLFSLQANAAMEAFKVFKLVEFKPPKQAPLMHLAWWEMISIHAYWDNRFSAYLLNRFSRMFHAKVKRVGGLLFYGSFPSLRLAVDEVLFITSPKVKFLTHIYSYIKLWLVRQHSSMKW